MASRANMDDLVEESLAAPLCGTKSTISLINPVYPLGGQQQRLCIARTIAGQTDII